jgi:hypothetical protein
MSSHLLRFGSAQDSRDVPPLMSLVEVADVCRDQMLRAHEAYGVDRPGRAQGWSTFGGPRARRGRVRCRAVSSDACWAKPDLDAAADAMRQLDDHPDVTRELGRRTRASVTVTHDATTAAASFGEPFGDLTGAGVDR